MYLAFALLNKNSPMYLAFEQKFEKEQLTIRLRNLTLEV